MSTKFIAPAALALMLASAGASSAQQLQYDRTSEHMMSYGPQAPVAPAPTPHATRQHAQGAQGAQNAAMMSVPFDRTSEHMFNYGPTPSH